MQIFEWVIVLLVGAALLSALARRLCVPYPTLLAIGGTCLAFIPGAPEWTLDPDLALTLFVAPVLLDAAYDTSVRDLRDNWAPVGSLVVVAVGTTTAAVACAARLLVPHMPWSIAIALGAVVAPPDAAAVTAVMRQVRVPHRLVKILEGESLLNDAGALIVYRLAIAATVSGAISTSVVIPTFALVVVGSIAAGLAVGWLFRKVSRYITFAPNAIIAQFASTFGVWMGAEAIGLSGILTIVSYAITIARVRGADMPPRMRIPAYAVWDTAVFILNAFAFVLIGMQLRPIWQRLAPPLHREYIVVAVTVLATVIVTRFAWVMTYNAFLRFRIARRGFHPPRPMMRPSVRGGVVISWAGMRGIVTLAAAFAIPERLPDGSPFPYRDLILLTAFCVVFGTLVIQGLSLRPLISWMGFDDADPVVREVKWARGEAYRAALASIGNDTSESAEMLRAEYRSVIDVSEDDSWDGRYQDLPGNAVRRRVLEVARKKVRVLRRTGAIGDDAYHVLEAEFDWAEMSAGADG